MLGIGLWLAPNLRRRNAGADGSAIEFLPGQIVDDGSPAFVEPPVVVEITDGIKFKGRKTSGASGKFIYTIGLPAAGRQYTLRYDPDWSQLENGGVSAMVGFGVKRGNDFRVTGLKGDGLTGLKAYEIYGGGWNQTTGFSTSDGGAADNGTQAGPNWLRLVTADDNSTYTLQSSADGSSWTDEFTDIVPAPFGDLDEVTQFGIAVFLEAGDAGPFNVDVTLWTDEVASDAGDPHWASVVFLSGFDGADGATSLTSEDAAARTLTFVGNAQLDTAIKQFGASALLLDGTGDVAHVPDSADWILPGPFTVEGFINYVNSGGASFVLIRQGRSANQFGWWVLMARTGPTIGATFSTDGFSSTHSMVSSNLGAGVFDAGQWHHFAFDRDSSNKMRVYLNGIMRASKANATGSSFNSNNALCVGASDTSATEATNGSIDEVRITKGVSRYGDTYGDGSFTPPSSPFPRS